MLFSHDGLELHIPEEKEMSAKKPLPGVDPKVTRKGYSVWVGVQYGGTSSLGLCARSLSSWPNARWLADRAPSLEGKRDCTDSARFGYVYQSSPANDI